MLESYDLQSKLATRQAYIQWRMTDVPAAYTCQMPVSYMGDELWAAEKSLREQYAEDQRRTNSQFIRGPVATTLDLSEMTAEEQIEFFASAGVVFKEHPATGGMVMIVDNGERTTDEEDKEPMADVPNVAPKRLRIAKNSKK